MSPLPRPRLPIRPLALALVLLGAACSGTRKGKPREAGARSCDVPTSGAALLPWLQRGAYLGYAHESKVHESKGPHPELVRTYVNDLLAASLAAGGEEHEHPACSAAVKELYEEDGTTRRGWAVSVKLQPTSNDGDHWYWYEITDPAGGAPVADGDGVGLCKNCHYGGNDFVLIPFPLQ